MNDSVLMRVLHRLANRAKQLQTLAERRIAVAAVLGERNAVDVLHDEPGRPVAKGISVIEARYGRMIQLREHALFTEEALAACGRYPGIAQDFDRHEVAEILAFGEINRPHAALAQFSQDAVGAELMGRGRRRIRTVQQIVREVGNVALQQRAALCILSEQRFHLGEESGVITAGGRQKRMLFEGGKIQCLMKEALNPLPTRAVHVSMRLAKFSRQPGLGGSPVAKNGGFRYL